MQKRVSKECLGGWDSTGFRAQGAGMKGFFIAGKISFPARDTQCLQDTHTVVARRISRNVLNYSVDISLPL